ncbi:hypothetical protein C8Q78DRAFT_575649 [Trametes maxima]|nr:hypothetical protein C8Q78DRAFT_575649 [Trametes maxima]
MSPAPSALQFAPPSPTTSSNSSVSSISLLPPASMSPSAPNNACPCPECEAGFASSAGSSATSFSPRTPTSVPLRNTGFNLLAAPDAWSYKSAKTRSQRSQHSLHSSQTLPTVDEDSDALILSLSFLRCSRSCRCGIRAGRIHSQTQASADADVRGHEHQHRYGRNHLRAPAGTSPTTRRRTRRRLRDVRTSARRARTPACPAVRVSLDCDARMSVLLLPASPPPPPLSKGVA